MKQKFSTKWVSSKQPRKQRKYSYNAGFHIKHKFLSANLSKELRKKYGRRSISVRKGDEVLIMRGSFADKKAKVASVNLKKIRVLLENINRTKKDGSKTEVYFHPSNLQIQLLNNEDKKRLKNLSKKENKETKNAS